MVQISTCGITQNVNLMLDTGSAIIPMPLCVQYFPTVTLTEAKLNLVSYGGHTIPVTGCFEAELMYNDRHAKAELFVVKHWHCGVRMRLVRGLRTAAVDSHIVTSPYCTIN